MNVPGHSDYMMINPKPQRKGGRYGWNFPHFPLPRFPQAEKLFEKGLASDWRVLINPHKRLSAGGAWMMLNRTEYLDRKRPNPYIVSKIRKLTGAGRKTQVHLTAGKFLAFPVFRVIQP